MHFVFSTKKNTLKNENNPLCPLKKNIKEFESNLKNLYKLIPGFRVCRLGRRRVAVSSKVLDESRTVSVWSKERDLLRGVTISTGFRLFRFFMVALKVSEAETETSGNEHTVRSVWSKNNK